MQLFEDTRAMAQVAAGSYKDQTRVNSMTKLTKQNDVDYKTKLAASLDKSSLSSR